MTSLCQKGKKTKKVAIFVFDHNNSRNFQFSLGQMQSFLEWIVKHKEEKEEEKRIIIKKKKKRKKKTFILLVYRVGCPNKNRGTPNEDKTYLPDMINHICPVIRISIKSIWIIFSEKMKFQGLICL